MKPLFQEPAGRENKPAFEDIPEDMLHRIGRRLSGEVVDGQAVYGSYSASAGYMLTMDSSLKIFAKGNHPGEMAHGAQNLRQEIAAYESLAVLKDVAPSYYSFVSDGDEDGWMLGLWEFITQDPMAHAATGLQDAMAALTAVHAYTPPADMLEPLASKNYMAQFLADEKKWRRIQDDLIVQEKFLALFEDKAQGAAWLKGALPQLVSLQEKAADGFFATGMIHGDLRMDNILFSQKRTLLIDWPNVCIGPRLLDLLFLCPHLESMGIGKAEDFLEIYRAAGGVAFADATKETDELAMMLAAISGVFADQAHRAVPEKLPRLRWMQKSMLLAQLNFLSRIGKIESPPRFAGQA